MTMLVRPLIAVALLIGLTACATSCPPGTHSGKFGYHCYPDRGPPPR